MKHIFEYIKKSLRQNQRVHINIAADICSLVLPWVKATDCDLPANVDYSEQDNVLTLNIPGEYNNDGIRDMRYFCSYIPQGLATFNGVDIGTLYLQSASINLLKVKPFTPTVVYLDDFELKGIEYSQLPDDECRSLSSNISLKLALGSDLSILVRQDHIKEDLLEALNTIENYPIVPSSFYPFDPECTHYDNLNLPRALRIDPIKAIDYLGKSLFENTDPKFCIPGPLNGENIKAYSSMMPFIRLGYKLKDERKHEFTAVTTLASELDVYFRAPFCNLIILPIRNQEKTINFTNNGRPVWVYKTDDVKKAAMLEEIYTSKYLFRVFNCVGSSKRKGQLIDRNASPFKRFISETSNGYRNYSCYCSFELHQSFKEMLKAFDITNILESPEVSYDFDKPLDQVNTELDKVLPSLDKLIVSKVLPLVRNDDVYPYFLHALYKGYDRTYWPATLNARAVSILASVIARGLTLDPVIKAIGFKDDIDQSAYLALTLLKSDTVEELYNDCPSASEAILDNRSVYIPDEELSIIERFIIEGTNRVPSAMMESLLVSTMLQLINER